VVLNPVMMAVGAFLLTLGSAMIATNEYFLRYGLYSLSLGLNLSQAFVYGGLLLAPIGAAILVYGAASADRVKTTG
jgi:hypothetical protein